MGTVILFLEYHLCWDLQPLLTMPMHQLTQGNKVFRETKSRAMFETGIVIVITSITISLFGLPGVFLGRFASGLIMIVDPIILSKTISKKNSH